MFSRRNPLLSAGLIICSALLPPVVSTASSQSELRQLVLTGVRQNEALLRTFEIDFSIEFLGPDGERKTIDPNRPNQIVKEDYYYVRKDNKLFCDYNTHFSEANSVRATMAFDGKITQFYRFDNKTGLVEGEKRYPTCCGPDRFTNLYRNVRDLCMSEFLEKSTIKHVRPCSIQGHAGYLIELVHCDSSEETPVEQSIYIDAERGFVPVKVETFRLDLSRHKPVMVAEVLEFGEFQNNIHFPVRAVLHNFKKTENAVMSKTFSVLCTAQKTRINTDVPDSIFHLKYPPGTHVYDALADTDFVVGESKASLSGIERFVSEQNIPVSEKNNLQQNSKHTLLDESKSDNKGEPPPRINQLKTEPVGNTLGSAPSILHSRIFWLVAAATTVIIFAAMLIISHYRGKS